MENANEISHTLQIIAAGFRNICTNKKNLKKTKCMIFLALVNFEGKTIHCYMQKKIKSSFG